MKVPAFLMGASLLFWGWQTEMMPLAAVMAVLLEGRRWIRFRINLSPVDFRRVSDFNTLVFVVVMVFVFISHQSTRFIYAFLQWVPAALLPIILAQTYSATGRVDPGAIFWSLRKPAADGTPPLEGMDLGYPYLFVVIICAGAANVRTPWFYAAVILLAGWSLWPFRNRRFSPGIWVSLLVAAVLLGYGGHFGLNRLQLYLAATVPHWMSAGGDRADTYRSMTAIGDVGILKMSDRVLFRVETKPGEAPPSLLRRTSFNFYLPPSSTWVATQTSFERVSPETGPETGPGAWKFGKASGAREATVIDSLRNGQGVLKIPTGSFAIKDLPVGYLDRNIYGAVRVYDGPGLVIYRVSYGEDTVLDSAPSYGDLLVPAQEKPHIARLAKELHLSGEPPAAVLAKIESFFRDNFSYSLVVRGAGRGALEEFLTRSRSGHCEFFATSTVLLLREAGIPARYATGFSVQDFSRLEKRYVIRARHAHAWALAFIGGSWRDLDTTPAGWGELENMNSPWWTPLSDIWALIGFKLSQWRWLGWKDLETDILLWVLLAAAAFVAARFLRRKSLTFIGKGDANAEGPDLRPGLDSEFYEIEKILAAAGHTRQSWEPVSAWLAGIDGEMRVDPIIPELHYRLRFDPLGLPDQDRAALKEAVRSWIADQTKKK